MIRSLSPAETRAALAAGAQLADVRERPEWDAARVEGAVGGAGRDVVGDRGGGQPEHELGQQQPEQQLAVQRAAVGREARGAEEPGERRRGRRRGTGIHRSPARWRPAQRASSSR